MSNIPSFHKYTLKGKLYSQGKDITYEEVTHPRAASNSLVLIYTLDNIGCKLKVGAVYLSLSLFLFSPPLLGKGVECVSIITAECMSADISLTFLHYQESRNLSCKKQRSQCKSEDICHFNHRRSPCNYKVYPCTIYHIACIPNIFLEFHGEPF